MEKILYESSPSRYYITVSITIFIMVMGLSVFNPRIGLGDVGFLIHVALVIILSVCLLIYPKFNTRHIRFCIVLISFALLYLLFFLYPDTGSTILLICFIPAISILFFDTLLFYFSIILNKLLLSISVAYIKFESLESMYPYLTDDLIGNCINLIISQIILAFIFHLTSERIKRQQMLYEQMKHNERLKTAGELAAAVAHEIRNPLTVVKGYLQIYDRDAASDSGNKQKFRLLIEELETAEQVVTDLLSLSKPSINRVAEKINVQTVIDNVAELLQSYGLSTKNKIEIDIENDCTINMNKMELHQVLVNIIKNAIEASYSGDSIVVRAVKRDEDVIITVTDYGKGMSSQELESIGTPFYSLKSKGTGLGIMICNQIVVNNNGSIHYESAVGKGTTVTIKLPYYH
ncbi:ATP-binding protein [Lysinibacillus endophyticus]|uniref:ATP-binding protein n=1 Tax=Ureibacillus endophyticus TaxID=1978490 RepID=UPI003134A62F